MKRINKVLLALVLTFGLFMVCDLTYADQMGPCSNNTCTLSLEKVDGVDPSLVNPEFLSLKGWETLYAVSISSDSSFIWNGKGVLKFGANDVNSLGEYIPVGNIGSMGTNKKDGYFYVSTTQDKVDVSSNKKVIGYLVTDESASDITAEFAYSEYYSDGYDADVTVNGIKSKMNNDYIDVDIFFGDFQYNYVVKSGVSADNYWEAANKNSGQLTIDNTNSITDLICDFNWYSNVSSVGLQAGVSATASSFGIGDAVLVLDKYNTSNNFSVALGTKAEFNFLPDGGDLISVKNILNQGGTLGRLSLRINAV